MKQPHLLLVLPLLLAGCDSPSSVPPPVEGSALRETINKETAGYGECVLGAIKSIELKDKMASTLADEAFANCRAMRDQLRADVLQFRRIGHPSEPEVNSKLTAEQSVLNLDGDLRQQVLVIATRRKLSDENGNNAAN